MSARGDLIKVHDWVEDFVGGYSCLRCTPSAEYRGDEDPTPWPCQPLRDVGVTDEEAREVVAAYWVARGDETRAQPDPVVAEGQRQADTFNAAHPMGTRVMAYPGVRPEDPVAVKYQQRVAEGHTFGAPDPCKRLDTVTRTPAWTLGHGEPVVSVVGYAGGISLEHIDVIEEVTS